MTTIAATTSEVLRQKTQLKSNGDYQDAAQRVSNFRYELLREMDDLPVLLQGRQLPDDIEKQQAIYCELGKNCLTWIWDCQSHISNPKSEMCYKERTLRDLPEIKDKVEKFWENRSQLFPNQILPEPEPAPKVGKNPLSDHPTGHRSARKPQPSDESRETKKKDNASDEEDELSKNVWYFMNVFLN